MESARPPSEQPEPEDKNGCKDKTKKYFSLAEKWRVILPEYVKGENKSIMRSFNKIKGVGIPR